MKLGGSLVIAAALVLTGCVSDQPPVSEKVQKYYDEHVVGATAGPVTATATLAPAAVAFIGDSYSASKGAWTTQLAAGSGWKNKVFALGGTGYAKSIPEGGTSACGREVCGNYLAQAVEAIDYAPDMVIVSGGRNDLNEDLETVEKNAGALFQKLTTSMPAAKVVVTSPVWDASEKPARLDEIAAVVKKAATSSGVTYVDLGQPFAGHPEMIGPDGIHPNAAGHKRLADVVRGLLG